MCRLIIAAIAVLFSSAAVAEEIPLNSEPPSNTAGRSISVDSIWHYGSAGERSLRRLEPDLLIFRDTPENIKEFSSPEALKEQREKAKQSLVIKIEEAIRRLPIADPKVTPAPGFIVRGMGREALSGVVNVLVEDKKPEEKFPAEEELSLVFFTHPTSAGVGIESVDIKEAGIRVTYYLTSGPSLSISPTLYLIPLGKLAPGKYAVDMIRSANESLHNQPGFPAISAGVENRIVCRPFKFVVSE